MNIGSRRVVMFQKRLNVSNSVFSYWSSDVIWYIFTCWSFKTQDWRLFVKCIKHARTNVCRTMYRFSDKDCLLSGVTCLWQRSSSWTFTSYKSFLFTSKLLNELNGPVVQGQVSEYSECLDVIQLTPVRSPHLFICLLLTSSFAFFSLPFPFSITCLLGWTIN